MDPKFTRLQLISEINQVYTVACLIYGKRLNWASTSTQAQILCNPRLHRPQQEPKFLETMSLMGLWAWPSQGPTSPIARPLPIKTLDLTHTVRFMSTRHLLPAHVYNPPSNLPKAPVRARVCRAASAVSFSSDRFPATFLSFTVIRNMATQISKKRKVSASAFGSYHFAGR